MNKVETQFLDGSGINMDVTLDLKKESFSLVFLFFKSNILEVIFGDFDTFIQRKGKETWKKERRMTFGKGTSVLPKEIITFVADLYDLRTGPNRARM